MGAVYRAVDVHGRTVALKLLLRAGNQRQVQRLLREGALAGALEHPNVVQLLDAGVAGGRPYLSYALVEGARTLDQAFAELDLEGRVTLLCAVAAGVAHAHERGIVHRDLKPANVLVDQAGCPRVADFGMSTAAEVERLTLSGAMVGTPQWMAPEQVAGDRAQQGPASDVWALGVLLYQALTDCMPFDGPDLTTVSIAITSSRVVRPRAHVPAVSPALERVCLRALSRDPARRYPHAGAFREALLAALQDPGRQRAGVSWLWGAGAGALALGVCAAAWVVLTGEGPASSSPGAPPAQAAAESPPGSGEAEFARVKELLERDARAALEGAERLATVYPRDPRGWVAHGEALVALGAHAEAERSFRKALELGPSVPARVGLASCLLSGGDREGALAAVNAALELEPGSTYALAFRALLHYTRGRYGEALRDADAAVALREDYADAWNNKGLAHLGLKQFSEAERALRRSLECKRTVSALGNLSGVLERLGRPEEALEVLEEALALDPQNRHSHDVLGVHHYKAGRFEQALEAFDRAVKLEPDHAESRLSRARTLLKLGRRAEAIRDLEHLVEHAPHDDPDRQAAQELLAQLGVPSR
ncbi:MAG: tetratricopeptide repeat protein [Planctomycetes bacterium]|nr:tetratricopeptide repeat protein [Planctomycetota bacterium]